MEANKRDWNSVGKGLRLLQVRESSVLNSYHGKRAASSLVADCTNPQRPPAFKTLSYKGGTLRYRGRHTHHLVHRLCYKDKGFWICCDMLNMFVVLVRVLKL